MLNRLPAPLRGSIGAILLFLNLITIPSILLILAFFRWVIPSKACKKRLTDFFHRYLTTSWIALNSFTLSQVTDIEWDIQGTGELSHEKWYFLIANHQSWVDILILQQLFNRKIPTLTFFMKQELLWTLPFASWVCWVLGFPFMKRHSKTYLKKHPEQRGKDMEATLRSCEKAKSTPTTLANFLEGTRFTPEKQAHQRSPYQHLLKPKAGGLAFSLYALKEHIDQLINVTLVYHAPTVSFWDFLCGRIKKISIRYEVTPVPESLIGDYYHDKAFRRTFQRQINAYWEAKDKLIESLK